MPTVNTVEFVSPKGGVALRAADGSYLLAQQIDAQPLRLAQLLDGELAAFGIGQASDPATGARYEFFVEAWGLSREAVLKALA